MDLHPRIAERAREPRYTIPEASAFVAVPVSTLRRWSLGHTRKYRGEARKDEPLIQVDGPGTTVPLSFLNLLELRFLGSYRQRPVAPSGRVADHGRGLGARDRLDLVRVREQVDEPLCIEPQELPSGGSLVGVAELAQHAAAVDELGEPP